NPDLRRMHVVKANYGRTGAEIRLRWHDGAFIATTGAAGDAATAVEADRVFLDLLDRYTAEGRRVGPNEGKNYAPAIFAKDERSGMLDSKALADAMNRQFDAGVIRVQIDGPPSKRREIIVRVDALEM